MMSTKMMEKTTTKTWVDICSTKDLLHNSGICALLPNQEQAAIFMVSDKNESQIFAISNFDPIGKANVLSRGIVGSENDEPVVASPLYKQHFSLLTGKCLQDENIQIKTYPVLIEDEVIKICA
jgi:nitrite reductase (NADH) small subunit